LQQGGSSLDAVQASVVVLEDSEFFNAGKGAVLTRDKTVELDASIMSGDSRAGAVGGVKKTKNPILLARQVMDYTPFVFLIGEEADKFASQQGLEIVSNSYFITDKSLQAWQKAEKSDKKSQHIVEKFELGTVGAVALDQAGGLAAATSTGGINYKMAGRVGDSAVIGAGIYATELCAVSCTGQGEAFIRKSIASFVCQLIRMGASLEEAAFSAIFEEIASIQGRGGLIAIDCLGRCVMPFNTSSMSRGYWQAEGNHLVFLD
jgi:beta-aspartyl-peptidase (threonine type)